NNGILVWQPSPAYDGTQLIGNRIRRIKAAAGGSGQNGNAINVFRAAGVLVAQNTMLDCAYSAVRGNAASNLQIVANQARRIGEVALYAEFGFQGAVIAQNVIDTAATGISVTNFNVGGRLAVVHGNLVRNLQRREHEPVDKRGNGIAVEADATVTGNTVEGAPTAGLVIGWGQHMRNVVASGNAIRDAGVGVMVTGNPAAGRALIANNMIARVRDGAVRRMTRGALYGPDLVSRAADPRIVVRGNIVTED
ncbi:MAG: TIGR03808 family TAT-translocated repetitive protein, partial [Pseudomonadota bacterium]